MMSSVIRIRTFDQLKWKHIIPNNSERWEIFDAKIVVYAGDNEEY
jgi:hypothetical protein